MDNVGEHVLDTQADGWGEAPPRRYCLREIPTVQQARPRPPTREVLGYAGGGRGAGLPEDPQLHESRFGEGDEARLNQHLLDWAVELLDDLLHHIDRKSTRLNSSHRCISYAV